MNTDIKITYNTTILDENSNPIIVDISTKIQKPNGDWCEVTNHYSDDGLIRIGTSRSISVAGVGTYKIDDVNEKLWLIGEKPIDFVSEYISNIEDSDEFVESSFVLDQPVSVMNWDGQVELSFAKELDGICLREVQESEMKEAVNIEFGSFDLINIPSYTVDTSINDRILVMLQEWLNESQSQIEIESEENLSPNCNRRSGCPGGGTVSSWFCLANRCACICNGEEITQYDRRSKCCMYIYGSCYDPRSGSTQWSLSNCDSDACFDCPVV